MIIYHANAKCILMANAPQADIEFLSPSSSGCHRPSNIDPQRPSMRIRLSRHQQSVEIAGYLSRDCGGLQGEWTKTVVRFHPDQEWGVGNDDVQMIDDVAKECLREM